MTEFYFRDISFVELRYIKKTTVKENCYLGGCSFVLSSVLMALLVLWHSLFSLSRAALLSLLTTKTFCKGKNKTQRIVIHYRFVGIIDNPVKEENIILEARQGVAVEYLTA